MFLRVGHRHRGITDMKEQRQTGRATAPSLNKSVGFDLKQALGWVNRFVRHHEDPLSIISDIACDPDIVKWSKDEPAEPFVPLLQDNLPSWYVTAEAEAPKQVDTKSLKPFSAANCFAASVIYSATPVEPDYFVQHMGAEYIHQEKQLSTEPVSS